MVDADAETDGFLLQEYTTTLQQMQSLSGASIVVAGGQQPQMQDLMLAMGSATRGLREREPVRTCDSSPQPRAPPKMHETLSGIHQRSWSAVSDEGWAAGAAEDAAESFTEPQVVDCAAPEASEQTKGVHTPAPEPELEPEPEPEPKPEPEPEPEPRGPKP